MKCRRRFHSCVCLCVCFFIMVLYSLIRSSAYWPEVKHYESDFQNPSQQGDENSATKYFYKVPGMPLFIYSAIASNPTDFPDNKSMREAGLPIQELVTSYDTTELSERRNKNQHRTDDVIDKTTDETAINNDVIITAFDKTEDMSYDCCVLYSRPDVRNWKYDVIKVPARLNNNIYKSWWRKIFKASFQAKNVYTAKQYICSPPEPNPTHITLTRTGALCPYPSNHYPLNQPRAPSNKSTDRLTPQNSDKVTIHSVHSDSNPNPYSQPNVHPPPSVNYVPIHNAPQKPGQLAICAKVAHSGGLDPEKIIEWFEVQRLLGVDHVLLFDLGNPEKLERVFRYYIELGMLDLQPYELPGEPRSRSLMEGEKFTAQFLQDETLPVMDCRARLSGYDMVLGHDLDEMVIPRSPVSLKQVFLDALTTQPKAAGFYFQTQFFIYFWGPSNPENGLMVTRFQRSTGPRFECWKYVYFPSRVKESTTHTVTAKDEFTMLTLPSSVLTLHHYRHCPDVWPHCHQDKVTDGIMTRYTAQLEANVKVARKATGVKPVWEMD